MMTSLWRRFENSDHKVSGQWECHWALRNRYCNVLTSWCNVWYIFFGSAPIRYLELLLVSFLRFSSFLLISCHSARTLAEFDNLLPDDLPIATEEEDKDEEGFVSERDVVIALAFGTVIGLLSAGVWCKVKVLASGQYFVIDLEARQSLIHNVGKKEAFLSMIGQLIELALSNTWKRIRRVFSQVVDRWSFRIPYKLCTLLYFIIKYF